ncbi:hypothetical protein ES708_06461 [subsurface metagenome]
MVSITAKAPSSNLKRAHPISSYLRWGLVFMLCAYTLFSLESVYQSIRSRSCMPSPNKALNLFRCVSVIDLARFLLA